MYVSCVCCVCRVGSGLCDGLITGAEGVLRCVLVCVCSRARMRLIVYELETSTIRCLCPCWTVALQEIDKQYADDVILRRVRVTIFAVERQ